MSEDFHPDSKVGTQYNLLQTSPSLEDVLVRYAEERSIPIDQVQEVFNGFKQQFSDATVENYLPIFLHRHLDRHFVPQSDKYREAPSEAPESQEVREQERAIIGLGVPALLSSLWNKLHG